GAVSFETVPSRLSLLIRCAGLIDRRLPTLGREAIRTAVRVARGEKVDPLFIIPLDFEARRVTDPGPTPPPVRPRDKYAGRGPVRSSLALGAPHAGLRWAPVVRFPVARTPPSEPAALPEADIGQRAAPPAVDQQPPQRDRPRRRRSHRHDRHNRRGGH